LDVLACAGEDLGFPELKPQTFGVQAACMVMHLLRFSQGSFLEVMLDEKLEVVVVEEPRLTRLHHGFKSLGQRDNLLLSLMWTSFFVHA
jgi:hypothetical protein